MSLRGLVETTPGDPVVIKPKGSLATRIHSIGGWGAITMGKNITKMLFDLLGLLIFLELAAVSAVLAYQRVGWSGALLAPGGVLVNRQRG